MTIITTQLDALYAEMTQRQRVVEAKAQIQMARNVIGEVNVRVQEIVALGALNTIPTEVKTALNQAWTALKTAQTALEAANVQEALNWAGK